VVVVDVEHERRAVERLRLRADPRLVRAVDGDQDTLAPVIRSRRRSSSSGMNAYSTGSGASP